MPQDKLGNSKKKLYIYNKKRYINMVKRAAWMFDNRLRGENHPNAKLTSIDVITIRELHSKGFSIKVIAKNFKVSGWNIRRIVDRRTWVHL